MNIKFISYSGKYPNLCSGVLTVEIDGKEYKFGHESDDYDFETNSYKNDNFEQFWVSGGYVKRDKDWDMKTEKGFWELRYFTNNYPKQIIDLLPELIDIFNKNVPYGCCGGCI